MLMGAFISRFIGNRLPGRWGVLQSMNIDFRKPLVPPDTIQIEGEITNISKSAGQVTIKMKISDSQDSLLATAVAKSIVRQT
jgi:acyl-CoA thioesterase FadM